MNGQFAVDVFARKNGLKIREKALAKEVSARVLQGERLPVAFSHEVQPGPAKMLTTIAGGAPREYDVVIEKVLRGSGHAGQNMVIRVTDEALLQKTGGILQGMSGSPLVQNGMLVGAVTHVFVDEPDRGYAIFAETVRNAEKNLDQTTRNAA